MGEPNLIPKNVMDEFKRQLQGSRGYDAKRTTARRFVYTTLTARFGTPWWNLNREKLLREMEVAEKAIQENKLSVCGDIAGERTA